MNRYYVDLHIHIGRTFTGRAVKITGAKNLTFSNIIRHARDYKGLNMIGIIDCHSPEVIEEMEHLKEEELLIEHKDGGLFYGGLTIIPGTELEIYNEENHGAIHLLCYFPTLERMKEFSSWLSSFVKNIHLSSQRVYVDGFTVQEKVKGLGGLFIPAHIFTPFKSLYGKGVKKSLTEVLDPKKMDAVELGLSSDTYMADQIEEIHPFTYMTNSDAHSLGKIAREYQVMQLKEPTFYHLMQGLHRKNGNQVIANYGLDPLLGKYYRTVCSKCFTPRVNHEKICPNCGHHQWVKGVSERIAELGSFHGTLKSRPPYIHQVPLQFIPGIGPKMLEKLLDHFGTEMAILHEIPEEALKEVVPYKIAELIMKARNGDLKFHAGGGGKYGKVSLD